MDGDIDAAMDELDKARADAPGPWDVEPAEMPGNPDRVPCGICGISPHRYGTTDAYHHYDAMACVNMLLPALKEATVLAEERLAGLDRLRAECEAWQKASTGWQARCGELEGLLGEAGVRRDQYKTMYYHLRERLERLEAMRGESTPG